MEVGLIGAIAAVVGGLVSGAYQHLRDWWTRPRLTLEFDCNDDKSEASWNGPYPFDGVILRASVKNRGRRPASNCKVFVVALDKIEASGTLSTAFRDSRQTPWAGWSFEPRALYRGTAFYVDFIRVSKHVSGWDFPFERKMAQDNVLFEHHGTYRFRLVAVADNAGPSYLNIDVKYDGDWHHLDAWKPSL